MTEQMARDPVAPADARDGGAGAGARALLGAQGTRALLQVVSVTVLSRLLAPADFGLFAVVAAVLAIAGALGDLGLSVAAIRERSLTREQWTALFWINVAVGAALTGLLLALSPLLADLGGHPLLRVLLVAAAPVFLLNGVSIQYRVELARRARFGALAVVETVAPAVGLAVGVAWALVGPGPWALVAQQVVGPLVLAVLAAAVVRRAPGLPRRRPGVRRLVRLGGIATVGSILNAISVNLAPLMLGRTWPAGTVGAFSRASQLSLLVHNNLAAPLTRVIVPSLARAHGTDLFAVRFRKALLGNGFSVGLLTAFVGGLAEAVVAVALGPQWVAEAPPVLAVLSIGLLLHTVSYVAYWAVLAAGDARRLLWCDAPGQLVAIAGVVLAAPWGPVAVSWAIVAGSAVRVASYVAYGMPAVGISPAASLRSSVPIVALCAAVFAGCRFLDATSPASPFVLLALGLGWTLVAGAVHFSLARSTRRDLRDVWRLGRAIVGLRRVPA